MRVSGLASGMDIDQIVKDLMKAERIPLDKLKQKKQTLEWQRDDYRSINTALLNFRQGILMDMKLSNAYRTKSTSSTNEAMVSTTATGSASASSYQISNVEKLATAATNVSANKLSVGGSKIDPTKSLATGSFAGSIKWDTGNVNMQKLTGNDGTSYQLANLNGAEIINLQHMTIKVDNKVYEIKSSTEAMDKENQVQIDKQGNLTFNKAIAKGAVIEVNYVKDKQVDSFSLSKDAKEFTLSKGGPGDSNVTISIGNKQVVPDADGNFSNGTGIKGKLDRSTGKITFDNPLTEDTEIKVEYNDKQQYTTFSVGAHTSKGVVNEQFLISSNSSLNDVINKVNASQAGVTMFYDSFSDKISLTRKETGDFNEGQLITTPDGKQEIIDGEEIITSDSFNQLFQFVKSGETGGQNASFTINGIKTERNSNTFTMNGVTFTLKQTFTDPVTVGISNNTNATYDNIKNFVTKYNELIDTIQKKTSEERYRDYKPLTDAERESLDDKMIEKWEEKAKSGLLKNDSILTGLLSTMRSSFSNSVSSATGAFKNLSSIGITTTKNYLEGGKLEIDEKKLKQALEDDPEGVESLFNSTNGVMQQLTKNINDATDKLKDRAGNSFSTNATFTIGRNLTDVASKITSFEKRLITVENRYYSQFTAMEKAIQKANSQSGYLSQMFSAG